MTLLTNPEIPNGNGLYMGRAEDNNGLSDIGELNLAPRDRRSWLHTVTPCELGRICKA
jgi:hypothetical protein